MAININDLFKVDLRSAFIPSAATTASAFALGKLGVNLVAWQSAGVVSGVTAAVQLAANKCFDNDYIRFGAFFGGLGLGTLAQKALAERLGTTLDAKGVAVVAVAMIAFAVIFKGVPALFAKMGNSSVAETGSGSNDSVEVTNEAQHPVEGAAFEINEDLET